ncbi:MAG: bifunctional serine/threonine-protein kinase/formylglycine-generating enzyme family protein [Kofleriaceae bacterium]|nr:bifunctional serine/threonine-protein kinase/formylglycine-generating enzyme family protein [Kofleriaceae bacterium]
MSARSFDGTALLVAGHGAQGGTALDASAVHTLGQIGEALLATGASWQIRRLTAASGERYGADRATIKRHIDELVVEPARVAVLVLLGTIIEVNGQTALVTGERPREYPEDATLPLAWIRDRLLGAKAEQLVVVLSAHGDADPTTWLKALGTQRERDLVAVDAPSERNTLADAMLSGLCGEALDPRTGTVTMASLASYLTGRSPTGVVQTCEASETIAQPPPLAGFWDVRRSQLAARTLRRAPSGPDDLTGTVLPGRFRVDSLVARGTFGTVYRARQLAVERDVALKVLNADIDPASDDGRLFVHEIRSAGRIDHLNVVRIYQADITHDGRLFFAMELLDGRDLHLVIKDGKVPRERATELVRQLLAGLGAAHDAGLVHADIKPANAIVVPGRDGGERVVLVDFGLSRLRAPDRPSQSAGGTPAYMAPEQMMEGRVDARSDLFSAALVFVHLLTGWRRPNAFSLVPPLAELVDDPDLRAVLERALAVDPARRYQTAAELSAALTGTSVEDSIVEDDPLPAHPFRHLSPLTENDRGRFFGREADLGVITEHALYRRSVIYTAPSGVGKTSLLRAGLVPRLEALGVRSVYHRVRGDNTSALVAAISPEATTIAEAIAQHAARSSGKLVLILDQLESALLDTDKSQLVRDVLAFDTWPASADVAVVLTIREDYLARLVARTQELEASIPIVRLPPLGIDGARDAIINPLAERRLAIEPELLDALLADLQRAASAIAPEMGWSSAPAVYPPHLQLACSVLYDDLAPGAVTFTLAHYKNLGGFDTIVGEHLERVVETELADGRDKIARDLFLALVVGQERAMRPEPELLEIVGAKHERHEILAVLEALRSRGLLVRVRTTGEASWELVHDSLVPRVLAWIDRRDLDRRRAMELLRYHLRRSRPDEPSLLGRSELKELAPYGDAVAELDAEWKKRDLEKGAWMPSRLIDRSRQVRRRRISVLVASFVILTSIAGVALYRNHLDRELEAIRTSLSKDNIGRFTLSLEPFDWDPMALAAIPIPATYADYLWTLHSPDAEDPSQPGTIIPRQRVVRWIPRIVDRALVEEVDAPAGPAFLVIQRRGCSSSIVPIRGLPGYVLRKSDQVLRIRVPSCQATHAGMIEIPSGHFIYGGAGDPPAAELAANLDENQEVRLYLSAFRMDRTEVTNAAFNVFADMTAVTGIERPVYRAFKGSAARPRVAVSWIDWTDARAYCRYLGKELPTTQQWTRAFRGGETFAGGGANARPRRNLPWEGPFKPGAAHVGYPDDGPTEVGTHPLDVSPEGIMDLAGNLQEWTDSMPPDHERSVRVTRGGNWWILGSELHSYNAIENDRPVATKHFAIGLRCVM